jgi:hypothetical protein
MRVARAISRPGDPECRYLYGSRQAWLLPGIESVDRSALRWLLEPEWALRTPRALLAKLEVTPDDAASPLRARGLGPDDRLDGEALEQFWSVVSDISPLIMERARRAREVVSDYLEQEGLHAPGRWALVDLGWRLTTQCALRRILMRAGRGDELLGFYFGISRLRTRLADAGRFRAFVLEDNEPEAGYLPESWVYNNTSLIENVFAMADHGSCTGYRREGSRIVPQLRNDQADPRREAFQATVQATIVEYARELDRSGLLEDHLTDVRAAGLVTGRLAVERPRREEAAAVGWVRVPDDQTEARTRELAAPLTLSDVWLRMRDKLGQPVIRDFETDSRWREGSLALTPPVTRAIFHALRRGEMLAGAGRLYAGRADAYRRWRRLARRLSTSRAPSER